MKLDFLTKFFKKDPKVGVKYKKIITAGRIYNDATILEMNNGNFVIKTSFIEDVSNNYIKLGIRSQVRSNFRNAIALLTSSVVRYTGEQGDYLFYTRLSRQFFFKHHRELMYYAHHFVEYENNAIVKCVKYTDDSL